MDDEYGFMANTAMVKTNHVLPNRYLMLEYDNDVDVLACIELGDDSSIDRKLNGTMYMTRVFLVNVLIILNAL